jgi:hypothetical protein
MILNNIKKPRIMKNFIITIQKRSENLNSLLVNKKSLLKSSLIILFGILLSSLSSYAQQCSFKLTTTSNIESVNKEGRTYFIQLQNNSNEEMKINISIINHNKEKNPDETDKVNNVNLNANILNEDGTDISSDVLLRPNEILKFQVKVTVPEGTPIKHWNSLLLKATSDKCVDYSSSLILHTFIPNPEER